MSLMRPFGAFWGHGTPSTEGRTRWDLHYRGSVLGAVLSDGRFYADAPMRVTTDDWFATLQFAVEWKMKYCLDSIAQARAVLHDLQEVNALIGVDIHEDITR